MSKLNDIIYWERSVGPGNRRDLVPMYFRGRLSRDTNEGMRGDVKARPVRLGKGPYVAVYGADAFVNREGERLFGDKRRTRSTRFGSVRRASREREPGLTPVRKIPGYAVIIRAIHMRGPDQREALRELKRRGLWLSNEQRRQAGLRPVKSGWGM